MIFKASTHFPENTIRIYAIDQNTEDITSVLPGASDFPGIKTAWGQIPPQKYRTLFGEAGAIAYLVKVDAAGNLEHLRNIGRKLAHREKERLTDRLAIHWQGADQLFEAFLNGLLLGTYQADLWKSEPQAHPLRVNGGTTIELVGATANEQVGIAQATFKITDTQMRCMDLVNAPANKKRPQDLARWAKESAQQFGYQVEVLDQEACKEEGLHALLAVNRGSEDPAQFIMLKYQGPNSPAQPTVLVGKGVTFDTGGISIKGSANLHLMKSDMGGAAAVMGTLEAAARLELPVHLVGLVPATDNSVDALSIKPSDVIQSHSGKTIEIIDTDAEGRLIMSDALSYAVRYLQPATLLDIATLTGSAVRTFGYECAALFSKNDDLIQELRAAGEATGERLWPLPMWAAYRSGLDSDVADIKNYSGRPINGAIDAAIFLESFTQEHPRYAHLDIAGVALKAGSFAKDRQATGFGIRLLINWLANS